MQTEPTKSIPKFLSRRQIPSFFPLSFSFLAKADPSEIPFSIIANRAIYRSADIEKYIEGKIDGPPDGGGHLNENKIPTPKLSQPRRGRDKEENETGDDDE
ncbi:MAG: hypothetical protein ACTSV1_02240 [Alphaproteobacteria bacterium]